MLRDVRNGSYIRFIALHFEYICIFFLQLFLLCSFSFISSFYLNGDFFFLERERERERRERGLNPDEGITSLFLFYLCNSSSCPFIIFHPFSLFLLPFSPLSFIRFFPSFPLQSFAQWRRKS